MIQVPNLQLVHGDVLRVGLDSIIQDMINQQRQSHESSHAAQHASAQALSEHSVAAHVSSSSATASTAPAGNGQLDSRTRNKVKIVANLPYNITKDFLKAMLPKGDTISELSIMIQEEVARRLVNKVPGSKDYRAMSVFTHFYSKPKYRFKISKTKYFPVPGVDGALVTFVLTPPDKRVKVPSEKGFMALVNKAFSTRRKMMRNSLQPLYTPEHVEKSLTACQLRPDARAEDLTLEQFVDFHWHLHELLLSEAGVGADKEWQGEAALEQDML